MRPRHKAAENIVDALMAQGMDEASMRPRHKAAENRKRPTSTIGRSRGFNEAAA